VRIIHDRGLAEDAVQTAFLQAVERIDQFDDHRPFKGWFLLCVVNATLESCTQQTRWVSLEDGKSGDASHDLAAK
jgi:DNA-directed RNA polymerase specialized sigma24 family protein